MPPQNLDEEQIFNVARKIGAAERRAEYLQQACGENAELRERVLNLLRIEDQEKSFLSPVSGPIKDFDASEIAERPGIVIGPYTLLEQIGEGGFGVVFRAEQTVPIRREVALKVLKPGMDTRQVVARFEAERQALAIMDHPNIARIFDGGGTASGRPFIVMELVKGVPITEHCDQQRLSPRERLELFVSVIQAVQHAHQKGIIHRDLKPSNVLVTMLDSTPTVKVIDFGVAKALGEALTDGTIFTSVAQMIGTPLYMSPEQAGQSGTDRDIDTRSDIYSLGVLLYEVLTGNTPFEKERFKQAAYDEIRRIIREEEPPKPSTRISEARDALPSISAQRRTEPAKLAKLVRGELDWIVMKALEKDRNRRYATANGLARDLQRFLNDEPVEASPPSAVYRWRKFARKNARLLATTFAFMLLLIVGLVASAWLAVRATTAERKALAERDAKELARNSEAKQRKRADDEAAIAKAVNEFLRDDLLGQADLRNQTGGGERNPNITVRELIDRAANGLEGKFKGQDRTEAAIRVTLGRAYGAIGELSEAQKHMERARALHTKELGANHPDTLNGLMDLARLYQDRGQYDDAERLYRQLLEDSTKVLGADHAETLWVVNNLALLFKRRGKVDQAEPLYQQALAGRRRTLGADHHDTLETMNNLAVLYMESGRYEQAEPIFKDVQDVSQKKHGDDYPLTILAMQNLATLHFHRARYDQAIAQFEKVYETRRLKQGSDHPDTLAAINNLAVVYGIRGRYDESEKLLKQLLEGRRAKLGADHPDTLIAIANLSGLYAKMKKFDMAIPLLEEALAQQREKLGASHPDTLITLANLGFNYRDTGRLGEGFKCLEEALELARTQPGPWNAQLAGQFGQLASMYENANQLDKAEALYGELLEKARAQYGEDHPQTATLLAQLGRNLLLQEKFDDAQKILETCLAIREKHEPDEWTTFNTKSLLGGSLLGQTKYAEAEPLLVQGYEGLKLRSQAIPKTATALTDAVKRLTQLYGVWGKPEDAARWREQLESAKANP
jgi:eukaryotic-like serine/threonine-protein kinase